jgi:hypothetical protein
MRLVIVFICLPAAHMHIRAYLALSGSKLCPQHSVMTSIHVAVLCRWVSYDD